MAAYLTFTEADAIAATLPATLLVAYLAASSPQKTAALEQASADVDAAGPFQGRPYETEADGQVLQFPRLAYDNGGPPRFTPGGTQYTGDLIWDWDSDTNAAVVPLAVKRAVLYQANEILDGRRAAKLDAQHSGLASQSADGVSESYRDPGTSGDGMSRLAERAAALLAKYRRRSGRLL
jgi:hypothetical protein